MMTARELVKVAKSYPCYTCVHYFHLYDREDIHTLDDYTDCWYETIPVYGCSLAFDDVDDCKCDYVPKKIGDDFCLTKSM